jgi:hypothetical protein
LWNIGCQISFYGKPAVEKMIILSIKFGYICKEMKNVEDISGKQKNRPKTRMDQGIDE